MKFLNYSLLLLVLFVCSCAKQSNPNTPVTHNITSLAVEEKTGPVIREDSEEVIIFAENNTVYFGFDLSQPNKEELSKIEKQAKWLSTHKFKQIIIEGHTDIFGSREYNLALGERRAYAIKDILVRYNIDPNKIKVVSYGKERLADNNVQFKNRRAVTKVVN